MRIVRFEAEKRTAFGVLEGDSVQPLAGAPWTALRRRGKPLGRAAVKLLAPVEPPDVFAIGLNYRRHADESGHKYPPAPVIFLKAASSVTGPDTDIVLPAMAPNEVDYECELAIVIGRACRHVSEADAFKYVLGYTCGHDVSARDCQIRLDSQWARGKSFATFCPLGPWIETDLDPDNQPISLTLNGQVMQASNTNDMIFNCRHLVSYCSRVCTLRPGTVIMSGTPSGVGFARKPQVFLRAGDSVEVKIDGIGVLRNTVRAEA